MSSTTVQPGTLQNVIDAQSLQWVFVGGKGGVGKTTTSSSLAIGLARHRESVLIVSTDPAHNVSDAFGQKFSRTTQDPTLVRGMDNLYAMEVEVGSDGALQMLETDITAVLGGRASGAGDAAIPALPALDELIKMVPGVDEAIAFGLLMESIRSMKYGVIVFDTAPTGHTLRLLSFPTLLEKALTKISELNDRFGGLVNTLGSAMGVNQGMEAMNLTLGRRLQDLQTTIRAVIAQFRDPQRTTFVCVCIPEFLSVYETERMVQELSKFHIDTHNIVINQILDLNAGVPAEDLFWLRSKIQMKYLRQIEELYGEDFHVTKVPILREEVRGVEMIASFGERLTGKFVTDFGVGNDSEFAPSLLNLIEQRSLKWIFCGGKGGVGKTTTSCTLASEIAKDRQRQRLGPVLIVSTDPAHNLSDAFKQRISPGGAPTKIDGFDNLYAIEIEPESGAESIATSLIPEGILPGDLMKDLAKSIPGIEEAPGIDEAVAFAQIMKLVRSMEFSAVIFDTAPTGHTLKLLNFPSLLQKAVEKLGDVKERLDPLLRTMAPPTDGVSSEDMMSSLTRKLEDFKTVVDDVGEQMRDPELTTFVCVAIAEFLSVYETERLIQELFSLNIDARNIVVNQLLDPNEPDKEALLRARAAMQAKYISQVEELYPTTDFHVTRMPIRGEEVRGLALLESFAEKLLNG